MTTSDNNDSSPLWVKEFLAKAHKITQDWDMAMEEEKWQIREQLIKLNAQTHAGFGIFWDKKLMEIGRWGREERLKKGRQACIKEAERCMQQLIKREQPDYTKLESILEHITEVTGFRAP